MKWQQHVECAHAWEALSVLERPFLDVDDPHWRRRATSALTLAWHHGQKSLAAAEALGMTWDEWWASVKTMKAA